jgi:lipoyl(octanoyl) transferase
LGYFQEHQAREEFDRLRGLSWLRRHTGGAAIVHHHELTYAIALPAGSPWHNGESWLCRFHHAVQRALKNWHINTVKPVICGEEQKLGPYLCFLHQTPGDLVCQGHKIAGSAQRRPHGAMVQHGSILLKQSDHTPELPGLLELTGMDVNASELSAAIMDELARETEWTFTPGDWTTDEIQHATEIAERKYANPEWNTKR